MPNTIKAEIYMGANIKGASMPVGENAFHDFLRRNVGFDGFTIFDATGYWQGEREKTRVLVLYGPNNPAFKREVRNIADAYAAEFNQDSVALAFSPAAFYLTSDAEVYNDLKEEAA